MSELGKKSGSFLMAIANIVQEPDFNDRWLDAAGPEHLRDILLLSSRKRDKHT